MQKLVNTVALLSGLVSLGVLGGGYYLYANKDAMIESARTKVTEEITKTITESLPGMINSSMPKIPEIPKIPTQTGGVIPFN